MKPLIVLMLVAFPLGFLTVQNQEKQFEPKNVTQVETPEEAKQKEEGQANAAVDSKDKKAALEPVDITEKAKAWGDGEKFAQPPTTFRKGHVSPRKLDPKATTKLETGYAIQLPSKAPIPTLTYYGNRIYASGGFHSKEFYCFNANDGSLVWAIDLDDDGPSSAVVEDDICVFNTESCTLFAVDASTGEQLWSWWLGDPLMSTPTISEGRVFTSYPATGRFDGDGGGGGGVGGMGGGQGGSLPKQIDLPVEQEEVEKKAEEGKPQKKDDAKKKKRLPVPPGQTHVLACFDLKTGKILWQRWIDSDVMSAPIADGGELFVTSFAGTVYKFKQDSGELISAMKMRATSAPTVVKGKVVVSQRDDDGVGAAREAILAMGRGLGGVGDDFEPKRYVEQEAAYLDKGVQGGAALAAEGLKLDAANGFGGGAPASSNWMAAEENIGQGSVSTLQAFQGSRSLHVRGYNFCCPGDQIVCNGPDGKERWAIKLKGDLKKVGGMLAAPPSYAGGSLLVSTLQGVVLQVDPEKGEIKKEFNIGSQLRFQPIVHEGKIFVGTQDGKVVCVDTNDKSLSGWTTWGGNSAHNKTE